MLSAARAFDYPPTPDLVSAVRSRLVTAPPRGGTRLAVPRLAWAAGLALIAVAGAFAVAMLASSGARDAVADFLGLSVEGEQITILPTPRSGETATPFPTPRALETYATPVPFDSLPVAAGFTPVLPSGAGAPSSSFVADFAGLKVVIFQYERFDLWQVRLTGQDFGKSVGGIFEKGLFTKESRVLEELTVNLQPAYWISNGSHIVRVVDARGTVVAGSERTVDRNTLVWRSATGINYRLETDLTRDEALEIARTLP